MGIYMPRPIKLIFFILLLAAVGFAVSEFVKRGGKVEKNVIRISGNIEVTDSDVSFKIAGRVLDRLVSEGEMVREGQIIARLESQDLSNEVAIWKAEVQGTESELAELRAGSRLEEIDGSRAAMEKAQSDLDELLAGSRPEEIAAAEATVELARASMENLKVEMNRYKKLFDEEVVSAEKYDKARTDYKMALAQVKQTEEMLHLARKGPRKEDIEQARAALRGAREKFKMVKKGPRAEKIDQASAKLAKAKASLSLAKTKLSYAEVVSPLTGVVISENIEAGEYVVPGTPIVTVGDLVNVWVRGYVDEEDLGRVKVGLNAQVTTDTYPEKVYEGTVSFISSKAEFTPKSVQTQKERVKLVYRIKVEIRNTNMELKPGMPVDVNIILHNNPQ